MVFGPSNRREHEKGRRNERKTSSGSSGLKDDIEDEDAYEFAPVHATRRYKEKLGSSDLSDSMLARFKAAVASE